MPMQKRAACVCYCETSRAASLSLQTVSLQATLISGSRWNVEEWQYQSSAAGTKYATRCLMVLNEPLYVKRRVLIVDDTRVHRALMKGILKKENCEIVEAHSGTAALDFLEIDPDFDIILLDIIMPQVSGLEVLKRIKDNPETAHIPVIMLTALSGPEEQAYAMAVGAADYVEKTSGMVEVLARIKIRLDHNLQPGLN